MNKEISDEYNAWNIRKKNLQIATRNKNLYFKEKDVWWCAVGLNIGEESNGKGEYFRRPILIIKKLSADLCIGLPLTSKRKIGSWFIDILLEKETRYVMLYQIRIFHKKRFQHKIGNVSDEDFFKVKQKLKVLLEFF